MQIVMDDKKYKRFQSAFSRWIQSGYKSSVDKGVKLATKLLKKQIKRGQNADGSQMKSVKESTMNSAIRHGGPDKRIRRNVNPSANKPIQATGESINAISSTRVGDSWTISPGGGKPGLVFEVNQRLGRDPLQPSDKQLDIIEASILKDFEALFTGV